MLSVDDNELLTEVGPRTPMGELMRQYWLPALLSSELPGGASPPGVDDPEVCRQRPGGAFLPESEDWIEATKAPRQAFVDHPELDRAVAGPVSWWSVTEVRDGPQPRLHGALGSARGALT